LAEGHLAKVIMRHHTLACINTNSSVKKTLGNHQPCKIKMQITK